MCSDGVSVMPAGNLLVRTDCLLGAVRFAPFRNAPYQTFSPSRMIPERVVWPLSCLFPSPVPRVLTAERRSLLTRCSTGLFVLKRYANSDVTRMS